MSLEYVIFDLDNTLYPPGSGVMEEIGHRIQVWLRQELRLSEEEATDLRYHYLHEHGTTMGGLMAEHGIDPAHYLDFVHQIDIEDHLERDPRLIRMLESIPLRKAVYTNATSEHGLRVLRALGAEDQFERVIGIEEVGLHSKATRMAYERMLALLDASGPECAMVEDSPRNLRAAKAVGMTTILVHSERSDAKASVPDECIDFRIKDVLEVGRVVDELVAHGDPRGRGGAVVRGNG